MFIGFGFITIGILIYINENYDINRINGERVFTRKKNIVKDRIYRYKILASAFSLILGIFRILSSIIY